MREHCFTAESDFPSLGEYLRREKGFSATQIRRLKRAPDCVKVNGEFKRMVDPLRQGDAVRLIICEAEEQSRFPAEPNDSLHADIIYEDDDVIVFDKPAAMPVHRSIRHRTDTLENLFASHCKKRNISLPFRPINRLDRDTTGLCAVAKNPHAAHLLSKSLKKEYTALCAGELSPHGIIDAPIEREGDSIITRRVGENGQRAVTEYALIGFKDGVSCAKFTLHTGRTHQIRVHMSHLGHPLLGDELYGGDRTHISRQALHCSMLSFPSPENGKIVELHSPLPPDMAEIIS